MHQQPPVFQKDPHPSGKIVWPQALRRRRNRPAPTSRPASALLGSGTAVQVKELPLMAKDPWVLTSCKMPLLVSHVPEAACKADVAAKTRAGIARRRDFVDFMVGSIGVL